MIGLSLLTLFLILFPDFFYPVCSSLQGQVQ